MYTPTKRSDAQTLVEYEKKQLPFRKRIEYWVMAGINQWIPTFVAQIRAQ